MLCYCKHVNFHFFSQYAKRHYWLSVTEAIILHVGDSEWDYKGSLGWVVQMLLRLRICSEFGRQSRDNKGEICLRLSMNLRELYYMY